ncbi:MAG: Ig-like domain-containing protein [Nannocystaceae bacterium]
MRTPGRLILPLVALASMIPSPAVADEPEALAPEDYYRANPIPVDLTPLDLSARPAPPEGAAAATLFVNFDGAQMSQGNDHAPTNRTAMPTQYAVLSYPAYGGGGMRAAVLQAAITDWMPFNVVVTDVRPPSGNYTMCLTGPGKGGGLPNGVLGIAPLDCQADPNHVVYAFHSSNDGFSASTQATTISQEIAHSFGLEHVNMQSDIMNPYNAGGDPKFLDQCYSIDDGGQGILCGSNHSKYCGNGSSQNSYQELLGLFGASAPDVSPPTVNILSPHDGDVFTEGDSFDIEVSAVDDAQVTKVDLYSNGALLSSDTESPYGFPAKNIPAGNYAFQAVAVDGSNNQGMSAIVNITVNPQGGGTTSGGSTGTGEPTTTTTTTTSGTSDSGSGTGGSTTDESTGGDDSDPTITDPTNGSGDDATASSALPPGYGDDFDDGGFCSIGGPSAPLGLGLVLLPLLRRRRRG